MFGSLEFDDHDLEDEFGGNLNLPGASGAVWARDGRGGETGAAKRKEFEELRAHLEPGLFRDLNQKRVKNQRRQIPMELYSFW